jgi:transposase-like protein
MNPSDQFCPNWGCRMRGLRNAENIVSHSVRERRYRCLCCGATFAETRGTPFYRLRTDERTVTLVVTLLAHGCPVQAVVAAFGFDERTVASWEERAGRHCEAVQKALIREQPVELEFVQADELWVKMVGRKVWMALAVAVPSRLWLGGVISEKRDGDLIRELVEQVRRSARSLGILVCVDGLSSYVTAFRRFFKEKLPREPGQRRGPRMRLAEGFLLGQVVKSALKRTPWECAHHAVCGTLAEIEARLQAVRGGRVINTAYIERLNATFRARLVPLIRRGRCLARHEATLQVGMYLVGVVYNFCCYHRSLREAAAPGAARKYVERTPAMAAGLAERRWSVSDLLHYRITPARWEPLTRHGPPPRNPPVLTWKLRPERVVASTSTV